MSYHVDFNLGELGLPELVPKNKLESVSGTSRLALEALIDGLDEEPEYIVKKFVKYFRTADESNYYKLKRYAAFSGFERLLDLFNEAENPSDAKNDGVWEFNFVDNSGVLSEGYIDEVNKLLRGKTMYDRFREEDPHIKEKVVELIGVAAYIYDSDRLRATQKELEEITYMP